MKKKGMYIVNAVMWIAVSVAVIGGMIITQKIDCLWAFLIPAFVNYMSIVFSE